MVLQKNPNAGKFVKPDGHLDLGWQLDPHKHEILKNCLSLGHKIKEFDNSFHLCRGTDVVYMCDECKYVHHVDMSD